MHRMILEVKEVRGFAGYKPGDRLITQEPFVLSKESTNVCLYAIGALLPYLTPSTAIPQRTTGLTRCRSCSVRTSTTRWSSS